MDQNRKKTKVIAIDFGTVRIGFAASDERKIFANALPNLQAFPSLDATTRAVVSYLADLEAQGGFAIEEIIVGNPLNMSGTESTTTQKIKAFVDKLRLQLHIPIKLWDERLTSVQAERSLIQANMSRKKRKGFVDRVSAAILLQSYLDMRHIQQGAPPHDSST